MSKKVWNKKYIFSLVFNEYFHIEFLSKLIAQLFSNYFQIQLISNEFPIWEYFKCSIDFKSINFKTISLLSTKMIKVTRTMDPRTAWAADRSVQVGARFFWFPLSWCGPFDVRSLNCIFGAWIPDLNSPICIKHRRWFIGCDISLVQGRSDLVRWFRKNTRNPNGPRLVIQVYIPHIWDRFNHVKFAWLWVRNHPVRFGCRKYDGARCNQKERLKKEVYAMNSREKMERKWEHQILFN